MASARLFRVRMRAGRALLTFQSDAAPERSASAGEEIVVPEDVAAHLVRQRAAEIIEVLDDSDANRDDGSSVAGGAQHAGEGFFPRRLPERIPRDPPDEH